MIKQAYLYSLSAGSFVLGLKFAGSGDMKAYRLVMKQINYLLSIHRSSGLSLPSLPFILNDSPNTFPFSSGLPLFKYPTPWKNQVNMHLKPACVLLCSLLQ